MTQELKQLYREQGILASSGFTDPRDIVGAVCKEVPLSEPRACAAAAAAIEWLLVKAPAESLVLEEDGRARSCFGLHRFSEEFARIAHQPWLAAFASEMVGEEVLLYQSHLNIKWPRSVCGRYAFHRDALYFAHRDGVGDVSRFVGVAVSVVSIGCQMGPLVTLAGSHRGLQSTRGHGFGIDSLGGLRHDTSGDPGVVAVDEAGVLFDHVFTSPDPGHTAFFDPRCIHASADNLSSRLRPMLLLFFGPQRLFPEERTLSNPYIHEVQE